MIESHFLRLRIGSGNLNLCTLRLVIICQGPPKPFIRPFSTWQTQFGTAQEIIACGGWHFSFVLGLSCPARGLLYLQQVWMSASSKKFASSVPTMHDWWRECSYYKPCLKNAWYKSLYNIVSSRRKKNKLINWTTFLQTNNFISYLSSWISWSLTHGVIIMSY